MADRKQHAQMITDHASVYQGASTPHHRSRAIDLYGFFYGLRAWGCLWRVDGSWCLVLTPVCEPGAVLVIAMHGSAAPATGAGNSEPGNLTPGSPRHSALSAAKAVGLADRGGVRPSRVVCVSRA
jgi:hypothetical protein